jgi:hypothetical protein
MERLIKFWTKKVAHQSLFEYPQAPDPQADATLSSDTQAQPVEAVPNAVPSGTEGERVTGAPPEQETAKPAEIVLSQVYLSSWLLARSSKSLMSIKSLG